MTFFNKNEVTIIKSLLYGFVLGFYFSVLFLPKNKIIFNKFDGSKSFINRTPFEYVVDILKISIITSILVLSVTLIFLYFRGRAVK